MKILPKPVSFEWDKGNIDKNFIKHKVANREIEEVFVNKPFVISKDAKHSQIEERFQALGITSQQRKLFVTFVVRNDKVRVISARDMSKKEEVIYEKV